jgi:hypothetical protein
MDPDTTLKLRTLPPMKNAHTTVTGTTRISPTAHRKADTLRPGCRELHESLAFWDAIGISI